MSWLARLKSGKPQEPSLQNLQNPTEHGFVGFVAPPAEDVQKTVGGFVGFVASVSGASQKFKASGTTPATGLLDIMTGAANDADRVHPIDAQSPQKGYHATPDPDRCCWPHGPAMNVRELDIMAARLARFTDKGVGLDDAEHLADKLVMRDREGDDRRLCVECTHLQGHGRWRCGNSERAGVAPQGLAPELVKMLQRCGGYTHAMNNGT